MASDPKLVARLETLLLRRNGVVPRKMFGGACFMLNGNMCVGVYKDQLIVRVGEERAEPLLGRAHVRRMDITGRPMKGWLMIAPAGAARKADLRGYVDAALGFVATLAAKGRRPFAGL